MGYGRGRLQMIYARLYHSAALSLVQLAVLLRELDNTPKDTLATARAAEVPVAFTLLSTHSSDALHSRLITFGRRMPSRLSNDLPFWPDQLRLPPELGALRISDAQLGAALDSLGGKALFT